MTTLESLETHFLSIPSSANSAVCAAKGAVERQSANLLGIANHQSTAIIRVCTTYHGRDRPQAHADAPASHTLAVDERWAVMERHCGSPAAEKCSMLESMSCCDITCSAFQSSFGALVSVTPRMKLITQPQPSPGTSFTSHQCTMDPALAYSFDQPLSLVLASTRPCFTHTKC